MKNAKTAFAHCLGYQAADQKMQLTSNLRDQEIILTVTPSSLLSIAREFDSFAGCLNRLKVRKGMMFVQFWYDQVHFIGETLNVLLDRISMMQMLYKVIFYCLRLSLLWAGVGLGAHAAVVRIDGAVAQPVNLTPYWEVFEDSDKRLTIDEVSAATFSNRFQTEFRQAGSLNFGARPSALWLRITLHNIHASEVERWLEISNSQLHQITLYRPTDRGFKPVVTGMTRPFAQRPIPHRNFVFPLSLRAGVDSVFYLRIASGTTLEVPARLWEPKTFRMHALHEYMGQAVYYGMLLALGLYNLLLYFSLKDRAYLLYVMFLSASALSLVAFSGLGFQFLWPESLSWTVIAPMIGFAATGLTLLGFQRRLLSTRETVPVLDRVMCGFMLVNVVQIIGFFWSFDNMIQLGIFIDVTSMLLVLVVAIACQVRRQRSATIFLLAFSFLLVSAMLVAGRSYGLPVPSFITAYGMQIGSALEMLLLSLALADRFHQLRQEKEAVQQELVTSLKRSEHELEQKVELRTQALNQTNSQLSQTLTELQQTQRHLVESEKMASLGALVAGVAHEINTPVGVGVTAASSLQDRVSHLLTLYEDGSMKKSDLERFLAMSNTTSNLILTNLARAAELIHSFKQIAVDQSSEERRVFNIKAYLADILTSLSPLLRECNLNYEIECPDHLELDSYPGSFSQIVTNLVINTSMHAYDANQAGLFRICVWQDGHRLTLVFSDDGKGIAQEHIGKIFDPFFTTRRGSGGSGLGLHIVYNLVKNKLNGTINCASEVGRGAAFTISCSCA